MKAIVNTTVGKLEMQDRPLPEPGPGQVRIKTGACAICATDLEMMGGSKRSRYPQILGHEWSGIVDTVGRGVGTELTGSRCVAENVLADGGEVGFEHPGGYGEYLITEARNLHLLPREFVLTTAALIEPTAVCVRGIRRLRVENREAALVFGDGPIGLILLMLLRRHRVKSVVLVGGRPERLRLAIELGATSTVNYHSVIHGLAQELEANGPGLFPNLIEASGSAAALRACFDLAAPGAHILGIGDYEEAKLDFPCQRFLHRELEVIASNASAGAWPEAVRLAVSHEIPLERLVSHTFPALEFKKAFDLVQSRQTCVIKAVLDWSAAR